MHPEFDNIYDYAATILLTNGAFFVYQQTGDQNRDLEHDLKRDDLFRRHSTGPSFIGFYTLSGRYVAVNHARIRHIRLLYNPKAGATPLPLYDDHFGIRETERRTKEDFAGDERQHRIYEAEEAGHPDDPMPDDEAEEAAAFLETMDMDLEAELPGIAINPMTISANDDIPDVIVYTAYPTENGYAENELGRNSYFYYDLLPGTLTYLDHELQYSDLQRRYLCLEDHDGDLDCIPMEAIWLMEISRAMLEEVEEEEETIQQENNSISPAEAGRTGAEQLNWNTKDEEDEGENNSISPATRVGQAHEQFNKRTIQHNTKVEEEDEGVDEGEEDTGEGLPF